jgi:hypothetical protein
MDEKPTPKRRRIPVVRMPDLLAHFDGDPWGVRLCALALLAVRSLAPVALLYGLHQWLR